MLTMSRPSQRQRVVGGGMGMRSKQDRNCVLLGQHLSSWIPLTPYVQYTDLLTLANMYSRLSTERGKSLKPQVVVNL